MKFIKIKIKDTVQWRLVIDNQEDVFAYNKVETEENFRAYLNYNNHEIKEGTREHTIKKLIDINIEALKYGEEKSPILILSEIQNKKIEGMLKCIKLDDICVNKAGGYCLLNSFLETHNAEIIETIVKKDIGFPNDDYPISSDLIILENDKVVDNLFLSELKTNNILTDSTKYISFTNLKLQDRTYVFKCIEKTKSIATQTQLMDIEQVDAFINQFVFLKDKKNIYIKTEDNMYLINHPAYNVLLNQHTITFLK